MTPFNREQYHNPQPRLTQLGAVRRADKDERGMQIWQSAYGWISVQRNGAAFVLSFYKQCPCGR